jgi:hypothetical protein
VFHVIKFIVPLLKVCISHKAGKELLNIVYDIANVKTIIDLHKWLINFNTWQDKWNDTLSKSINIKDFTTGREYVSQKKIHEKIRKARTHLANALENFNVFTYILFDDVPNTTNSVEGGVNSRIKTLIRCHPGLSLDKRKRVFEWRLWSKSIDLDLRDFL